MLQGRICPLLEYMRGITCAPNPRVTDAKVAHDCSDACVASPPVRTPLLRFLTVLHPCLRAYSPSFAERLPTVPHWS